jgi:hypothetical protein
MFLRNIFYISQYIDLLAYFDGSSMSACIGDITSRYHCFGNWNFIRC